MTTSWAESLIFFLMNRSKCFWFIHEEACTWVSTCRVGSEARVLYQRLHVGRLGPDGVLAIGKLKFWVCRSQKLKMLSSSNFQLSLFLMSDIIAHCKVGICGTLCVYFRYSCCSHAQLPSFLPYHVRRMFHPFHPIMCGECFILSTLSCAENVSSFLPYHPSNVLPNFRYWREAEQWFGYRVSLLAPGELLYIFTLRPYKLNNWFLVQGISKIKAQGFFFKSKSPIGDLNFNDADMSSTNISQCTNWVIKTSLNVVRSTKDISISYAWLLNYQNVQLRKEDISCCTTEPCHSILCLLAG